MNNQTKKIGEGQNNYATKVFAQARLLTHLTHDYAKCRIQKFVRH
jgi:hypothetical protein